MEYNPKYPQPFTLTQAIALDPAVACDEIARLNNSLLHLRQSQNELQEYLRELASEEQDVEVIQAVKENEITIASQDERIFMLKLALTHHGHPAPSVLSAGSGTERVSFNSNGLNNFSPLEDVSPTNPRSPEAGQENGVYL